MNKPKALKSGDKVAIVSLSSGMLGEDFAAHELEIGIQRIKEFGLEPVFMPNALKGIEYLKNHPEARAQDLKDAFYDSSVKGIICAIGGEDTYRTLPYLLEDEEFVKAVQNSPKLFTGFSDTTINHLMFYKLGMNTFYGPIFVCDLAELGPEMLPYSRKAFESYFGSEYEWVKSSPVWYEERTDFSRNAVGTKRAERVEKRGYEVLQGKGQIRGRLLGGCLESLYDILNGRLENEREICEKYNLFPSVEEWKGKILFVETCEEKPVPELFRKELLALKEKGVFKEVKGVLVGKPQDEMYYEEYKEILKEVINDDRLPIMYNINFGHAYPRCVIPYGINTEIDFDNKTIQFLEECYSSHLVIAGDSEAI